MTLTLTRRQWALIALVTLLWGLNWPMMKFALREVSPLYFRAITMSGGTLTLIAFFAWRGVPLGVSRRQAASLVWLALPFFVRDVGLAVTIIIAVNALNAFCSNFANPAWTAIVADIVPANIRGRFFSHRNFAVNLPALLIVLRDRRLFRRLVAAGPKAGYVQEHVGQTIIRHDEAVTLGGVEPFDRAGDLEHLEATRFIQVE